MQQMRDGARGTKARKFGVGQPPAAPPAAAGRVQMWHSAAGTVAGARHDAAMAAARHGALQRRCCAQLTATAVLFLFFCSICRDAP
jgi:hypothetical protein